MITRLPEVFTCILGRSFIIIYSVFSSCLPSLLFRVFVPRCPSLRRNRKPPDVILIPQWVPRTKYYPEVKCLIVQAELLP